MGHAESNCAITKAVPRVIVTRAAAAVVTFESPLSQRRSKLTGNVHFSPDATSRVSSSSAITETVVPAAGISTVRLPSHFKSQVVDVGSWITGHSDPLRPKEPSAASV